MSEHLTIGFLPLVDACLPILAHEHGFAEEEGLTLTFQRDVSWATVLDRLLYGHSDAAHLIAPLAIATTLGRGRPAQPLATPFVLGLNGNAITMTTELTTKVTAVGRLAEEADPAGPVRQRAVLDRVGRQLVQQQRQADAGVAGDGHVLERRVEVEARQVEGRQHPGEHLDQRQRRTVPGGHQVLRPGHGLQPGHQDGGQLVGGARRARGLVHHRHHQR